MFMDLRGGSVAAQKTPSPGYAYDTLSDSQSKGSYPILLLVVYNFGLSEEFISHCNVLYLFVTFFYLKSTRGEDHHISAISALVLGSSFP
jgi:hypothetical protein